jgi:hypothetical protein
MLRLGVGVVAAAIVVALPAGAAVRAAPEQAAFALLTDGRLVRVGLADGRIRVQRLGAVRKTIQSGPLLAVGSGRRVLYALLRSQVAVVDTRTLAIRRRLRLPSGLTYRGLALGRASGRLYVSGNRAVRVIDRKTGLAEENATLTILDAGTGAIVGRPLVREAAGRSWSVYWISLSSDERVVALAYHGGCDGITDTCTTGADLLALEDASVRPCVPLQPQFRGAGCTPDVHGAAVPYGEDFLAATGAPRLVEVDRDGRVVRRFATGMATHLMDLAVDAGTRTAFAVGSCEKGGGLRAIDLESGAVTRLRTVRGSRALCGWRVAVASSTLLVVPTGRAIALAPRIPSGVLVVDSRSGRTVRQVRVGARIADVAVA